MGEAISCTYQLNQEEISKIEKDLGYGVVSKWEFSITTKYNNNKKITYPDIDISKFLEFIGNIYQLNSQNLGILKTLTSKEKIINAINEYKNTEETSEEYKLFK